MNEFRIGHKYLARLFHSVEAAFEVTIEDVDGDSLLVTDGFAQYYILTRDII